MAKNNPAKKDEYEYAKKSVDSLAPIASKYHELGYEAMMEAMLEKVPLSGNEIDAFRSKMKIDVRSELAKEIEKADNKILRYGLIGMLMLFVFAFIYNEKLKS